MMEIQQMEMDVIQAVKQNLDQHVQDHVDKLQHQAQVRYVLMEHWYDQLQK